MKKKKIELVALCIYHFVVSVAGVYKDPLIGTENCFYNNTVQGTILSPNFGPGKVYENDLKCAWIIRTDDIEANIKFWFSAFDLELTKRCLDSVMFYQRKPGQVEWSKTAQKTGYCGKQEPFAVTNGNVKEVLLVFETDHTEGRSGFSVSVNVTTTASKPEVSNVTLISGDAEDAIIIEEHQTITLHCNEVRSKPNADIEWFKLIPPYIVSTTMPASTVLANGVANTTAASLNATHLNHTTTTASPQSTTPAVATKSPTADWESEPIEQKHVKNLFGNGSIQLEGLMKYDTGMYRCVATNKYGTSMKDFKINVKAKCLCPEKVYVGYYNKKPYTRYKDPLKNRYAGVFYKILEEMIVKVCNCETVR